MLGAVQPIQVLDERYSVHASIILRSEGYERAIPFDIWSLPDMQISPHSDSLLAMNISAPVGTVKIRLLGSIMATLSLPNHYIFGLLIDGLHQFLQDAAPDADADAVHEL